MNLSRNKNETSTKADSQKLVFSGKRLQGTWIMETNLPVPVRRSVLNQDIVVSDNRRVRTLH
ncbi:MAG TPA: hypothetical protein VN634_16475 [Candidatus Limnocylindrales bacterium]|nr:hypothetical protein [Candidatus Limnocylindrales bacterium]